MKLEEGGLSSSPGVVLYPAYCLINHACRWTQLEQSSKSDLSCFYIFTIFSLGFNLRPLYCTCLWLTCSATTPTTRSCLTWAWSWGPRCQSGRGRRSRQGDPASNKSCESKELFSFTFVKGTFPQLLATFDEKGTSPSTGSSSEKTEFFKIQNCKTYSSFPLFQLPLCTVQWSFWAGHPHVRIVWKSIKNWGVRNSECLRNISKGTTTDTIVEWCCQRDNPIN